MSFEWLKKRGYRHFDTPVGKAFVKKAMNPDYVAKHSFLPLIHYKKIETRYKICSISGKKKTHHKKRPIKYASHRDACILSYYAYQLNKILDNFYKENLISDNVIAYRPLNKGNYDFAAEAMSFAKMNSPVVIMAFDIKGFFDNLDHRLLKRRFKSLLDVNDLPSDWYSVFRSITRFHFVDLKELKAHPTFGARLKRRSSDRIASVEQLKDAEINFHPNPEFEKGFQRGIPQGTPISAAASNAYMIDFDVSARTFCNQKNALYRRYSDDILVICKPSDASFLKSKILELISVEKLQIEVHKTEETFFDASSLSPLSSKAAQYLGFTMRESGAAIRESSLSRQWRKLRQAIRRAKKSALWRSSTGASGKIHKKRLYKRFSFIKYRKKETIKVITNFSSYARRSTSAFDGNEKISNQLKRFERAALKEIKKL